MVSESHDYTGLESALRRRHSNKIIEWHFRNKRSFPWRETRDPFKVLMAEIMLQRTRSDQVKKVFERFFREFPNIMSISETNWESIENLLKPLGLRHRIPRIKELINRLIKDYGGRVPDKYEDLLDLPGVGPYIASAVLCFGFQKSVSMVDSNIARFYMRFFGLKEEKKRPHEDERILRIAEFLLPRDKAREFNEALLDFTALICKPKPVCEKCPLKSMCKYPSKKN